MLCAETVMRVVEKVPRLRRRPKFITETAGQANDRLRAGRGQ